jgi:hypothetical protein
MANLQRLTERVKKMEDWVKENEDMGGPSGTLDTMSFLINETRIAAQIRTQIQGQVDNLRGLTFEFINQHELTDEWNEFLKEKEENAVQEQSPEEVPTLTEAEDGEKVGEEDSKGKKPSKKSNKEKKD